MPKQKHHYVSQFYLKGFETSGKLSVLDKKTNKTFQSPTQKICAESEYFSLDELDNEYKEYKNIIEEELSKLESNVAPILRTIRKQNSLETIKNEEFIILLEWVRWIFIANPINKKTLTSMREKIQEIVPNSIPANNTNILYIFLDTYEKMQKTFLEREWRLCTINPDDGALITSDRPVNLLGTTTDGIAGLDTGTLYFPLSPQLLLLSKKTGFYRFGRKPFTEYSKDMLKASNFLSYVKSNRFIITNNLNSLNEIKECLPGPIPQKFAHPQIEYWDETIEPKQKRRTIKIMNR